MSKMMKHKKNPNYWSDLPTEILGLIHRKLRFLDQVRFRVVCKTWRLPKDVTIHNSPGLPWLILYHGPEDDRPDNLIDPYALLFDSHQQRSHSLVNPNALRRQCQSRNYYRIVASKYGYVLVFNIRHGGNMFLSNCFSGDITSLPPLAFGGVRMATFTASPSSDDRCEILVMGTASQYHHRALHIATYCLSSNAETNWSIQHLQTTPETSDTVCDVHYMEGTLYCLFDSGILKSYSLANKSWKVLCRPSALVKGSYHRRWLIEKDGNLLMICQGYSRTQPCFWSLYRLDWLRMAWCIENDENHIGTGFFLGNSASFAAPLIDDGGEKLEDCRIYYWNKLSESVFYSFAKQECLVWDVYPVNEESNLTEYANRSYVELPC